VTQLRLAYAVQEPRGSGWDWRKECPKIRGERPRLHRTRFLTNAGTTFPSQLLESACQP